VFVLGLYAELDKSGSDTPTSDAPLLDEKTVKGLVTSHVFVADRGVSDLGDCATVHEWNSGASDAEKRFTSKYIDNDIWVVVIAAWSQTSYSSPCIFTVHDKRAHVILPREAMTTD
jgi:hypothetical protein